MPPAPIEPKNFRNSPDSDAFDQFVKSQREAFLQSQYGKDMTDLASSKDFDSRRDGNSDIFSDAKYAFENIKRDPFGMARDVSPKSRDSFGMPSSRDIGVVPNTRDSFAVARQSFKKLEGDQDRRSSIASTLVRNYTIYLKAILEHHFH